MHANGATREVLYLVEALEKFIRYEMPYDLLSLLFKGTMMGGHRGLFGSLV